MTKGEGHGIRNRYFRRRSIVSTERAISSYRKAYARRVGSPLERSSGLFWSEVRNVLIVAERQGRIPKGSAELLVEELRQLDLLADVDQVDTNVIVFARDHDLAGYDAEFLETAVRRNARLLTFDRKLYLAAQREGVAIDIHKAARR